MKKTKNIKIAVPEHDIEKFPLSSIEIDEFWKSLYEGNKRNKSKKGSK